MSEDNYSFFDELDERDKARNKASKDRVAAGEETRAQRQVQRNIRRAERAQLGSASSISERRAIKDRFEKIQEGVESGGIYDVSTDSYIPTEGNEAGSNTNITDTGVQSVPRRNEGAISETFDVVESNNTAGTRSFLTE